MFRAVNSSSFEPDLMKMISGKINVNALHIKANSLQGNHIGFYKKYAAFVFKNLRKEHFQRFLCWLFKRENIDESVVRDIQVKVFPSKKKNGNTLAGKWKKGQIFIYPRSLDFYRGLITKHGIETARYYVKSRAWATLIHEILHAKYSSNEDKVRNLTKRYFKTFVGNLEKESFDEQEIFEMLFKQ